jgi:hypothetical protein
MRKNTGTVSGNVFVNGFPQVGDMHLHLFSAPFAFIHSSG